VREKWSWASVCLLAGGVGALALLDLPARGAPSAQPPAPAATATTTPATALEAFRQACGTFNPYFAVANFTYADSDRAPAGEPAIIAFSDTAAENPQSHLALATQGEVGAVYGLAYDAAHGHLYAASYHKRSTAFGPGGPGQIYEIDVATGRIRALASLYVGPDRHDFRRNLDEDAAPYVGRTGLGDIEVDDAGTTLFAMNMTDGRIHRFALPGGAELGSFRHGAAGETWARNARPFGLGYRDGWLYHGVVDSLEFTDTPGSLTGYVYRCRPDGSEMAEIAQFRFNYPRPMTWQRWDVFPARGDLTGYIQINAQPLIADIDFTTGGDLILGIRDRMADMLPVLGRRQTAFNPGIPTVPGRLTDPGVGDVLPVRRAGDLWAVITDPEHYDDWGAGDEASFGGLAAFPGADLMVTAARAPLTVPLGNTVGALWSWNANGGIAMREVVRTIADNGNPVGSNGLGDVEALCPPNTTLRPDVVPTATAAAVTATARAGATATAIALIPTAMATGTPEDFDLEIAAACRTSNPYIATVCYAPANLTQFNFDAATIVTFRDTAIDAPIYPLAMASRVGAVWGLGYASRTGTLYASAFNKRLVWFGPAGPGAIYWMTVKNGATGVFATVPDAGLDVHGPPAGGDDLSRDVAGKVSLGDLDLSGDERELFVVNLNDRRIYRFEAVSGQTLGSFANGAAGEPWAADARPFALKFHDGRLYHGLVHSAEQSADLADLAAYVYSSLPDGSDMRLETRIVLNYPRGIARVPGVIQNPGPQDVSLDWLPWLDGYNDRATGKVQMTLHPQPILSDIEFAASGDLILGLKDRHGDMSLEFQRQIGARIEKPGIGLGDILRVPFDGTGWPGPAIFDYYGNPADTEADKSAVGGLGWIAAFDTLVANRITLASNNLVTTLLAVTEGAIWYDDAGNAVRREQTCNLPIRYQPPVVAPTPTGAVPTPTGRAPTPASVFTSARSPQRSRSAQSAQPAGSVTGERQPVRSVSAYDRSRGSSPDSLQHSEWIPGKGMGDVEVLCGPTPTPTPTLEDTPTATPSRTPTPTATPTATSAPTPGPIYLPIGINDKCDPKIQPVDVVLVIDASTSMLFRTRAGRVKIDAAKEAAGRFLGKMTFPRDQAALVMFNASATILSDLTSDLHALSTALDGIRNREFTRIHLGIQAAHDVLKGAQRVADHTPVIVLLTDGRSNPDPVSLPLEAARLVKADGIVMYTVGLGDDLDFEALRLMASRPENFRWAPDGEDLGPIYEAIARTIPCPRSAFWPWRP